MEGVTEDKIVPSKDGLVIFFQKTTNCKQSENALIESEEQHRSLVEWTTDAIVVHRDAKVIYANAAAHNRVLASYPKELLGKPPFARICTRAQRTDEVIRAHSNKYLNSVKLPRPPVVNEARKTLPSFTVKINGIITIKL